LKKLQATHKSELKKARTARKSEKSKNHKPTGFARLKPVTGKLAEFIGVESGTELSGPEITAKIWAELKNRNLTFEDDKRVLRVDKTVAKLFNVPMSVNDSTKHDDPNGLNFGNLQKYIKNAMGEESSNKGKVSSK